MPSSGGAGQQVIADPQRVQADRLGVLTEGADLRPGGHLAGPVGHSHGNDHADAHASKSRLESPACDRSTGATRIVPMVRWKNLRAAFASRRAETNTSMTWPNRSRGTRSATAPRPCHRSR